MVVYSFQTATYWYPKSQVLKVNDPHVKLEVFTYVRRSFKHKNFQLSRFNFFRKNHNMHNIETNVIFVYVLIFST